MIITELYKWRAIYLFHMLSTLSEVMVDNNVNNALENEYRFEFVHHEQDSSYWFVVWFTQSDESQNQQLIEE